MLICARMARASSASRSARSFEVVTTSRWRNGTQIRQGDQRRARPFASKPIEHPACENELWVALAGVLQASRLGGIVLREQDAAFEVMAGDFLRVELLDHPSRIPRCSPGLGILRRKLQPPRNLPPLE
jgi:hypothetical protein